MTRSARLSIAPLTLLAILIAFGCSQPISDLSGPNPTPPVRTDTVIVHDTTVLSDTIIVIDSSVITDTVIIIDSSVITDTIVIIDTSIIVDTVIVVDSTGITDTIIVIDTVIVVDPDTTIIHDTTVIVDTITIVDTVIVTPPDTSEAIEICGQLSSARHSLSWLFANDAGMYRLEFRALTEKLKPTQVLVVSINGETFEWTPSIDPDITLDRNLTAHSTVTITAKNPAAFGHGVDICLWLTKLE
jgi:hypothetical protein